MAIRTVVFDLDGVIRHFDPTHRPGVEQRHDLEAGSLDRAAWDPAVSVALVTGRLTRAEWVAGIGDEVGSRAAADEWLAHRGSVDSEMMALVDELRAVDLPVSVLTNGTDTVHDELDHHGIADRFDRVFNSWDLGMAKPDPAVFGHVCRELAVEPAAVFFTDDTAANVAGALDVGLHARVFVDPPTLRRDLAEAGLGVVG
ncbi:MAG: HAD family hydrolase [Acidimicrobiales bacterium]